jgi:hypothetical protein
MKILKILRFFFIIYMIFIILLSIAGVIVPLLGASTMNIQNQAWTLFENVNYFPILGLVFPYEIMNFIENAKASVSFVDFFHIFIIFL